MAAASDALAGRRVAGTSVAIFAAAATREAVDSSIEDAESDFLDATRRLEQRDGKRIGILLAETGASRKRQRAASRIAEDDDGSIALLPGVVQRLGDIEQDFA